MKQKRLLALWLTSAMLVLMITACGAPVSTQPDSSTVQPANSSAVRAETPEEAMSPEADTSTPETTEPESAAPEDSSAAESSILIVYFSRVGVTPFDDDVDTVSSASINRRDNELVGNMQYLAEFITEETGGDLFQIVTEKEYPTDYRDTTDLAKEEQNDGERPVLTSHVEKMEQYIIFFSPLPRPPWQRAFLRTQI